MFHGDGLFGVESYGMFRGTVRTNTRRKYGGLEVEGTAKRAWRDPPQEGARGVRATKGRAVQEF